MSGAGGDPLVAPREHELKTSSSGPDGLAARRLQTRNVVAEIASAIPCPINRCGGHLVKRNGKHGAFFGCTNYPTCRFTDGNVHAREQEIAAKVFGETYDDY